MRIDWGYAYVSAPTAQSSTAIGAEKALTSSFAGTGSLPKDGDARMPRAVRDNTPTMAFVLPLGSVGESSISRHVMLGYDEIYSIKYFGKNLRPYWRRNGDTPATLFQKAEREYASITLQCEKFDRNLMADLTKVGGEKYARISALAYRQALAATGIAADAKGQPLHFLTRENTSNGDIATVDVCSIPWIPCLSY